MIIDKSIIFINYLEPMLNKGCLNSLILGSILILSFIPLNDVFAQTSSGLDVYQIASPRVTIDPGQTSSMMQANCESGDIALSGGYFTFGKNISVLYSKSNAPDSFTLPVSWRVSIANHAESSIQAQAIVMCLADPPAGVKTISYATEKKTLVPEAQSYLMTSDCKPGEISTGGGYWTSGSKLSVGYSTSNAPDSYTDPTGWHTSVTNQGSGNIQAQGIAICLYDPNSSMKTIERINSKLDIFSTQKVTREQECESGELAVGGGFWAGVKDLSVPFSFANVDDQYSTPTGWRVSMVNHMPTTIKAQSSVMCLSYEATEPTPIPTPTGTFEETYSYLNKDAKYDRAVGFDELIAKAEQVGVVRVMIGIDTPTMPSDAAHPQYLSSVKTMIAEEQVKVVEDLKKNYMIMRTTPLDLDKIVIHKFETIPYFVLESDKTTLEILSTNPQIKTAVEDSPMPAQLKDTLPVVGSQNFWPNGYAGKDYVIAVIDTGFERTHDMLNGKIIEEACFSSSSSTPTIQSTSSCPNGLDADVGVGSAAPCNLLGCSHGTHVAGIVAGDTIFSGPQVNYAGVAKDAQLVAIQVFSEFSKHPLCMGSCPLSYPADQTKALLKVLDLKSIHPNIVAVNLSLGGGQYPANCDYVDPAFKHAVDLLHAEGIAVIASSGNEGYANGIGSPACISGVISVGSTTNNNDVSSFSNSASILDFLAPGDDVRSSVPSNNLGFKGGTSMAAPHVAGAFAVLKQSSPAASISQITDSLKNTGNLVTDSKNGVVTPRIQIDNAICDLKNEPLGCLTNTIQHQISTDGTVRVEMTMGVPNSGDHAKIHLKFVDAITGHLKPNVNYDVEATQNEVVLLDESDVHTDSGYNEHLTSAFLSDLNDSNPIDVTVTLQGFGATNDSQNWSGPFGEMIVFHFVPEFGTISSLVLIVSLVSMMVILQKKHSFRYWH